MHVLRVKGKYAQIVAQVMRMNRFNQFERDELVQRDWKCQRRYGGVCYDVNFDVEGRCTVRYGSHVEKTSYGIVPNTYRSGAYAGNDVYLEIHADQLKCHAFWCSRGSDDWAPSFVQCWKSETDFVLQPAVVEPAAVELAAKRMRIS